MDHSHHSTAPVCLRRPHTVDALQRLSLLTVSAVSATVTVLLITTYDLYQQSSADGDCNNYDEGRGVTDSEVNDSEDHSAPQKVAMTQAA